MRSGKGKNFYKNGDNYEGLFEEDQKHGKGRYTYATKSFIDCDFQKNYAHGFGT